MLLIIYIYNKFLFYLNTALLILLSDPFTIKVKHPVFNTVFIHTYINNWSLQPFRQDYDLASHTSYVVCVNFIHECQYDRFSETFHGNLINSQSSCQKSAERTEVSEKIFFHTVLMSDLGFKPWSYV